MRLVGKGLIGVALVVSGYAQADNFRVQGDWQQTHSSGGHCAQCTIRVIPETAHIVRVEANNGWMGYASCMPREDVCRGVLEWKNQGPGRETAAYRFDLFREHRELVLRAEAFTSRYVRDRDSRGRDDRDHNYRGGDTPGDSRRR